MEFDVNSIPTVKIDSTTNTVAVDDTTPIEVTANIDATNNTVQIDSSTPINVSSRRAFGTAGFEANADLSMATGTTSLLSGTPSAGKVWIVNNVTANVEGTSPTRLTIYGAPSGSGTNRLFRKNAPASHELIGGHCNLLLEAGDKLQAQVEGGTLNDNLFLDLQYEEVTL